MGSLSRTETGHKKYREGQYEEALELYLCALPSAKQIAHRIALHSNVAACYLKLHSFRKAAEECSAVLELDPKHMGALMLHAQTMVALKDYHAAIFDVNRLIEINPSSDAYRSLYSRLKAQLSLEPIPEAYEEEEEEKSTSGGALSDISPTSTLLSGHVKAVQKKVADKIGWEAIPKPKGHSGVDYSRWNVFDNESSDDEDDDDEDDGNDAQPQFKFKLRTVGVQPVDRR